MTDPASESPQTPLQNVEKQIIVEHDRRSCHDLLDGLSDYIDGTADPAFCEELEHHLIGCENCRVVVDTLDKTISLYQMLPEQDVPDEIHDRLLHVLHLNGEDDSDSY